MVHALQGELSGLHRLTLNSNSFDAKSGPSSGSGLAQKKDTLLLTPVFIVSLHILSFDFIGHTKLVVKGY